MSNLDRNIIHYYYENEPVTARVTYYLQYWTVNCKYPVIIEKGGTSIKQAPTQYTLTDMVRREREKWIDKKNGWGLKAMASYPELVPVLYENLSKP